VLNNNASEQDASRQNLLDETAEQFKRQSEILSNLQGKLNDSFSNQLDLHGKIESLLQRKVETQVLEGNRLIESQEVLNLQQQLQE